MPDPALSSLFSDVIKLRSIGPGLREKLVNLYITRVVDLIYHLPVSILDRRAMPSLDEVTSDSYITSIITVDKHIPGYARVNAPYRVRCSNDTGFLTLTFFNAKKDYISERLPVGQRRVVSGRVEEYDGELQMPHPDYILPESELYRVQRLEPVYRLTQGLALRGLIKIMGEALKVVPNLPEWIDEGFLSQNKWKSWRDSLNILHNPEDIEDIDKKSPYYMRLAYDELLANQLALAIVRERFRDKSGNVTKGDGRLREKLLNSLPFKLTDGQRQVLTDIYSDMASKARMLRLLQGDVGSGKTVVAFLSALNAIECGKQIAFMAPTSILAIQHYKWISETIAGSGLSDEVSVTLLTGRDKAVEKQQKLSAVANGKFNIVIGTHALFQAGVKFKNLGMVVIDEQHKFGVKQRLALTEKGKGVDILLMTATPIPRTLALTFYGDIDISSLKEKPADRKPIDTRAVPSSRTDEIVEGLGRVIAEGGKAYWICPLIEESEESDLTAAKDRYKSLKKVFSDKVGLVHGGMRAEERDMVMNDFVNGKVQILVATTVVEVGVDVPDATIMIIEHAERFGLSQIHQLRGRVGRSDKQSACILLYAGKLGDMARRRLAVIRETNDGFRIAEEDLDLRGAGEVLGTRQSGMPDFRVASVGIHRELLLAARDDAKLIIAKDPKLQSKRGQALRTLLYLFEYNRQIKYLQSG